MKKFLLALMIYIVSSAKFLDTIESFENPTLKATETVIRKVYGKKLTLPEGDKFYFMPYKKGAKDSDGETQKDKLASHGDCILIESNGKFAMVDLYRRGHYSKVKTFLEDLEVKEIEFVLITHQHKDHRGDLEKLAKDFKVKKLYMKDGTKNNFLSANYINYRDYALKHGIELHFVSESDNKSIKFGNLSFELFNRELTPTTKNEHENGNSITALVKSYAGKTVYLSGDIQKVTVKKIVHNYGVDTAKQVGSVDVYKVAHHGKSEYNNLIEELKILRPKYSIMTIDEKQSVCSERLKSLGSKVYRAGVNHDGAVVVNIDPTGDITIEHTK